MCVCEGGGGECLGVGGQCDILNVSVGMTVCGCVGVVLALNGEVVEG